LCPTQTPVGLLTISNASRLDFRFMLFYGLFFPVAVNLAKTQSYIVIQRFRIVSSLHRFIRAYIGVRDHAILKDREDDPKIWTANDE